MTTGEKIKKIRIFRGMTQRELGLAAGFSEKGADNRIAQYETNYRIPKKELLVQFANALNVDAQNFYTESPGAAEDFMRTFFWLEEDSPGAIHLFQLDQNLNNENCSGNPRAYYHDSDAWPAKPPIGLYFRYGLLDEFMHEWLLRQQELEAKQISKEEYFEWKINWPRTCDDCGKREPTIQWRKDK